MSARLCNALTYSHQTWYVYWQTWPEATCTVLAQCHLVVKRYERFCLYFCLFCLAKNHKLISLDSVQHAESNDTQFSHIGHLGCWPFRKMLHFMKTFAYCYGVRYVCLRQHVLTVLKKFECVVKSYNEMSKNANNFWLKKFIVIKLNRFLGLCREQFRTPIL